MFLRANCGVFAPAVHAGVSVLVLYCGDELLFVTSAQNNLRCQTKGQYHVPPHCILDAFELLEIFQNTFQTFPLRLTIHHMTCNKHPIIIHTVKAVVIYHLKAD